MIRTNATYLIIWMLMLGSMATHTIAQESQYEEIAISYSLQDILLYPASGQTSQVVQITNGSYKAELQGVPTYSQQWPLAQSAKVQVNLNEISYEKLNEVPQQYANHIQESLQVYTSVHQDKGRWYVGINFVPIVKNGNTYKIVTKATAELIVTPITQAYPPKSKPVDVSRLATGAIYKLAIANSGVYKIDADYLAEMGIQSGISSVSIWAQQGGPLPELIREPRIDDLSQLPIYQSDGALFFYAEGPHQDFTYNPENQRFDYITNVYADENYVFLKVDETVVAMNNQASLSSGSYLRAHYDEVQRHEVDTYNLLGSFASTQGSGQKWYGEIFSIEREQSFGDKFDFSGIQLDSDVVIHSEFAGRSSQTSRVTLSIDNESFTKSMSSVRTGDIESRYARVASLDGTVRLNNTTPNITIQYPPNGTNSEGWLDYIQVQFEKNLDYNGQPIIIRDIQSIGQEKAGYSITNWGTQNLIWDITDPFQTKNQQFANGPNGAQFYYDSNELKTFICFTPSQITASPTFVERVENQNLHGIANAEAVIVYHPDFAEAAQKLANHRANHDGLQVVLANIFEIYNEFSAGKQDPTAIRDFAKMIYDRDPNFNYLVLLGDGSYDYRGISPGLNFESFVPAYETRESINPLNAFPTDDYYTLLSDNEGGNLKGAVDIAVGRLPAKDSDEANVMVDKIINYDTNPDRFGDWKLRIAFTADDEDSNTHLNDADGIARSLASNHEVYNIEKIYFDAFKQESTPGGARYPLANQKLNTEIFKGLLLLNYLGHGGSKGWSQERVLQIEDIINWDNEDKLPFIITATCSFTGFDDPAIVTGGEESILNPNGGAVGLFSTVRSVFASQNERLTSNVFDTIFSVDNGSQLRIGEVLRRSKNASSSDTININARKFLLIGDPTMKLGIPQYGVETTMINGVTIRPERQDTLRALDRVTIAGHITDQGQKVSTFNGKLTLTCFDKEATLQTLGNDSGSPVKSYKVQRNVLFKGEAEVINGDFTVSFVIPKDIDYTYGLGKLSYYAHDNQNNEAKGLFDNFIIGGSSDQALVDDQGPNLKIFMNDENFVSGGITNDSPNLLIKFQDDIGINFTGNSIGHDITAIIDDNTQQTLILNDFYTADANDFTQGTVLYPLEDIAPGLHTVRVKAFDVANNSTEALAEFVVVDQVADLITQVYNYPNPFTTFTEFMFEHSFTNIPLSIQVDIYTLSGKLVKTIQEERISAGFRVNGIGWNGTDDFGSALAKGVYLFKIKVEAPNFDLKAESDFQKLVIIK